MSPYYKRGTSIVLDAIRKVQAKYPDLRVGQIVANAHPMDLFYTEDDVLARMILELFEQRESKT